MWLRYNIIYLFLFICFSLSYCDIIEISNIHPRIDSIGNIMDIHDGNILHLTVNKKKYFYYFGLGYTNCFLEHGLLPP